MKVNSARTVLTLKWNILCFRVSVGFGSSEQKRFYNNTDGVNVGNWYIYVF